MLKTAGVALLALAGLSFVATSVDSAAKRDVQIFPVGSVPEDELGKDIDGNPIRISDYHGKVVILSFWASWCEPCRKELPVLAGVVKQVGPDHLQVLAVNHRDEVRPFRYVVGVLKDYPIKFMKRDPNAKLARKFGVQGIPRMIIIGRDGKVAADHIGYAEEVIPQLVDELNKLLAEKPAAKSTAAVNGNVMTTRPSPTYRPAGAVHS